MIEVTLVDACLRGQGGGSPTAVITDDHRLGDTTLARIPGLVGVSHVAVLSPLRPGVEVTVRFFTPAGELPSCGHGTVAALTVLAHNAEPTGPLHVGGRNLHAATGPGRAPATTQTWLDQGLVTQEPADPTMTGAFLAALGITPEDLHPHDVPVVASPGRPRLLIPIIDRRRLAALRPDHTRLAAVSRRYGQPGCFVHTPPTTRRPAAARMFAPAIGVPEDVANANSTGCLAAHYLATGREPTLTVDQGDALGRPSTVYATATRTSDGITTRIGGTARRTHTLHTRLPHNRP